MSNFGAGINFVFTGIGEFFRHKVLWKYAAIPFVLTLVLYTALFYWGMYIFLPQIIASMENFFAGRWFEFLYNSCRILTVGSFYLIFFALTLFFAANIFEISGSWFFSRMVRCYERKVLGRKIEVLQWHREARNVFACIFFSTGTLLIYLLMIMIGFFLPGIGFIITIPIVGYRYATTYCSEAVFNQGYRLHDTGIIFDGKQGLLYGFGSMVFLLFLIPFVPIFLIPGFVIGGTLLYHHRND